MLRGVVLWGAAVLAGLALSSGVLAQGANPNSRVNVVPAAAGLEAEREALFQEMFRDPSNLDIAFRYAELSVQAGDLEAAISTLERMLVYAPGLPRLQFELGVLYFRLGAYETAAAYLRAVDADPDLPPDVRAQVGLYLAEIDERASGTVLGGSIAVGVRHQTNANAGPGSPNISIFGSTFLLSPNALSQPDTNGFVVGRFNASIDLESQGDRFDVALNAFGALYNQLNGLNTGIVELRAGPTFNLQRFSIDNATLGLYAIASGGLLGGAPYVATLGAGSALQFVLDARSRVRIKGEAVFDQYYDSAMRPTSSLRTGPHYSAQFGYDFQLSQDIGLFLTVSADRRVARRGYLSNWQAGAEAGVAIKVPSPVEMLTQPWTIALSAGIQHQRGDAPDPVFSMTAVEATTRVFAQGTLTVPLPNAFAVQANAIVLRSMSNYGLSVYDNFGISAAISKGF